MKKIRFESCPTVAEFVPVWYRERAPEWKPSFQTTVEINLRCYITAVFGDWRLDEIDRGDVYQFRADLASGRGPTKRRLSNDRVNHILSTLRGLMREASERFRFPSPAETVGNLPVQIAEVDPFSLQDTRRIIEAVNPRWRDYWIIRFLTGLRTGELHGLQWRYVDFEHRKLLIRETVVNRVRQTPKTAASVRDVDMSPWVVAALQRQYGVTGQYGDLVFRTKLGASVDLHNITNRIWYPLLARLGLARRRPYQTRHTCATLWLAAGESPEWIAHQLGHRDTRMLFERYSRFVPNLTRQDGSAFARLIRERCGDHWLGDR